jgi:hypothetical protein
MLEKLKKYIQEKTKLEKKRINKKKEIRQKYIDDVIISFFNKNFSNRLHTGIFIHFADIEIFPHFPRDINLGLFESQFIIKGYNVTGTERPSGWKTELIFQWQ